MKYSKEHLVLAEKPYTSIQGEGSHVGKPMTYVRMQGCNVGCSWCDSYYTWYPYNQKSRAGGISATYAETKFVDILNIIKDENCNHVWFTGGEPMLQAEAISNFIDLARNTLDNKKYYICTAGTIWNPQLFDKLDHIIVDIKAPFSKTKSDIDGVVRPLYHMCKSKLELKMVVAPTEEDKEYAKWIANNFSDVDLTLQPLYVSEPELLDDRTLTADKSYWNLELFANWINDWARHYDNVRMGTQFHKYIWPRKMRGI